MSNQIQLATAKDMKTFSDYFKARQGAIASVCASHMNPDRLTRIVMACVSRTPALKACTIESIFRSSMQAAELGLEPGSALGEGYLVPYKDHKAGVSICQFIPGYRGLLSLAYRSGHVASANAKAVYQNDVFEYEEGLRPILRHVPAFDAPRKIEGITRAYFVCHLTSGGVIHDVMTRTEIDAIRARSKASNSGPWVTDFAEMSRKTVARRGLKYAPMSIEMSKALAIDNAAESGEGLGSLEFDSLEAQFEDFSEDDQPTKTERLTGKIPDGEAESQGSLA